MAVAIYSVGTIPVVELITHLPIVIDFKPF